VLNKSVFLGRVVVVLVVLLATGCGGGETLTKEQYVSKLNAMCEDFREREKKIGEPRTLADLVEKGPRVLDAFEKAIVDKVHRLKAPDEIADQADRLVDLADQQSAVLRELIEAAKDNDVAKVSALASKNEAVNQDANSVARRLGAEACAGE
jgi:hypothetical protein